MLKYILAGSTLALFAFMSGPSDRMQGDFPLVSAPAPSIVDAAPPQYWSPPGAFVMAFGSPAEVDAYCMRGQPTGPRNFVVLACTHDGRREVAMPNPCLYQHEYYAKLLCHEQAHLSRPGLTGWRH